MSDPIELGVEQPIEDVLEQQREDGPSEEDRTAAEAPGEADEADVAEQRVEVPLEDDRYPAG